MADDKTEREWHEFCRPFVYLNGSHEMPNYPAFCRAVLPLASHTGEAEPSQIYWHNPQNGQVWSDTDVRFHCKDTTGWSRVVIPSTPPAVIPRVTAAMVEQQRQIAADAESIGKNLDAIRGQLAATPVALGEVTDEQIRASAYEHCFKASEMATQGEQLYMFDLARIKRLCAALSHPAPAVECRDCCGTGIDGDCGSDGRTIDIECGACNGTGRTRDSWQVAIERLERVFQKSVVGMVPAEYATGYTEALSHVRRALAATPAAAIPAAPSEAAGRSLDELLSLAEIVGVTTARRTIWPPTFRKSIDFTPEQLERFAAALTQPTTVQQAWALEDDPYYNLLGVIADAKSGNFNAVCIETLERIAVQLKTAPTAVPGDAG